jgi:hypothetical protein
VSFVSSNPYMTRMDRQICTALQTCHEPHFLQPHSKADA